MKKTPITLSLSVLLLAACGGGGGGSSEQASAPPPIAIETTNSESELSYQAGENIVFSIGDIELPEVLANRIV